MTQQQPIGGRFELHGLIGRGGMGEVYRGYDTQSGQTVAIKALKPEFIQTDPDIVERFEREGDALSKLNHPNIVKVLASFKEGERHYIVMEYVSGGSLADLLRKQPQLRVERVLAIALDLTDALTRTHRLEVIHRDIKPPNVLLADDGTPRLTDFGIAHIGGLSSITQDRSVLGTYHYLSPEACNGERPDKRTDIWAFGVMLYEMLAGRRPFEGDNPGAIIHAILNRPVPDLAIFCPDVPARLTALIGHMLEKDRSRRITSVRQVGSTLETIMQSMGSPMAEDLDLKTPILGELPAMPSEQIDEAPLDSPPEQRAATDKTIRQVRPDASAARVYLGAQRISGANSSASTRRDAAHQPNFDLIIARSGATYTVQVQAAFGVGNLPSQSFALPLDLAALPRRRRDVAEWVERARIKLLKGNNALRLAQEFGTKLFQQLFRDEVLACFRASRAALPLGGHLCLRLNLPPELIPIPWELLYDPLDDQFLALARDLVLVRYPPSPIGTMPTLAANPLRVLVILASPEGSDYSRINLDRELRRIRNALKDPLDRKQVVLDVIRGPDTLGQLRMQLRNPAQIVHILCHGDLDERSGEGVLIFEDADGAADLANAELLRQYFQRQRGHLRLVLLNACLGALPADDDPFSSVGAALLRSGVPAVIAMQFELPEDAAVELTQVFYAEAAAGAPIGMALTEARLQLYGRYPSRLDWAIPVLFLRTDMPIIDEWSGQNEPPVEVWSEEQELRTWAEQADHLSKSSLPDGEAIDALLTRIDQQHPGYRHPTIDLSALRRRVDLQRATQQITAGQGEAALTTLAGLFTQQKADRDAASLLVRLLLSESLDLNLRLRAMQLATEHGDLRPDVCTLPPALVPIAGGRFVIGSTREEIQRAGRSYERAYLERGDLTKAREARNWPNDEGNDQQLTLAAFAINRYLVTNAQYALFIADDGYDSARPWWQGARKRWLHTTSHTAPRDWPERKHLPNHPIVGITWYEAQAFCQWLSQHRSYNPQGHTYRLPNEAEWEYAVRGAERRLYPWGMQAPDIVHANFGGRHHDTTPVGCFLAGATPEGIYDLAGNVWEWTSSVYRPYPYRVTNARDRSDDVSGETFTVRGGCWRSPAALLRASHRHYYPPSHYDRNLGFRLIRELPATPEIQRRG